MMLLVKAWACEASRHLRRSTGLGWECRRMLSTVCAVAFAASLVDPVEKCESEWHTGGEPPHFADVLGGPSRVVARDTSECLISISLLAHKKTLSRRCCIGTAPCTEQTDPYTEQTPPCIGRHFWLKPPAASAQCGAFFFTSLQVSKPYQPERVRGWSINKTLEYCS